MKILSYKLFEFNSNLSEVDAEFIKAFEINAPFPRMKELLSNGANINVKNADGLTWLMYSIEYNRSVKYCEAIIGLGADINITDNKGNSALILCDFDHTEHRKLLISYGADLSIKDDYFLRNRLYGEIKYWLSLFETQKFLFEKYPTMYITLKEYIKIDERILKLYPYLKSATDLNLL